MKQPLSWRTRTQAVRVEPIPKRAKPPTMTVEEFRKVKPKRSKYGNTKTVYNGITFHSKKEAAYCMELDKLKAQCFIESYQRQVPYTIAVNGIKICKYIADFVVFYHDGTSEVVDVKGMKTAIYKLKAKMMLAIFGIKIKEVHNDASNRYCKRRRY